MRRSRRNQIIYTVLFTLCVIGFWWFENFYNPAVFTGGEPAKNIPTLPDFAVPSSTSGVLVNHNYYSLSYREDYEQAEWVAYALLNDHLTRDDRKRPYFYGDPQIRSKSANWRNYRGSGFDRGHLCPAGDRRFSEEAYNETFYTSNISPQRSDFNAGVWNRLEIQVRSWARSHRELCIVTGGVLSDGLPTIGEEEVAIPGAFFKIVQRGKDEAPRALAFLIPHQDSSRPLTDFLVPIDSLEELTGINFFPGLADEIEDTLESSVKKEGWEF